MKQKCKHAFNDETVTEEGFETCIYCGEANNNTIKCIKCKGNKHVHFRESMQYICDDCIRK